MYYFIVNTQARRGNAAYIWNEVKIVLKKNVVPYKAFETSFEGHATKLARELTENISEPINIIILGGDGTINEVINGISDFSKVRFGVIPTGSGNDFAGGLGIKGSTEAIIQDILSCNEGTKLDLGCVKWDEKQQKRLFAISSGVGFDALVCKKSMTSHLKKILNAIHLGNFTYVVLAVQSLLTMDTFGLKLSFGHHSEKQFEKVIFSAAMNLRAEGGGVPMAPGSKPSDGLISFCCAAGIPKLVLIPCFILLVLAKHENLKYFHTYNDNSCYIHSDTPIVLHADGEYLADVTDIWYECMPYQLEILNTVKDK